MSATYDFDALITKCVSADDVLDLLFKEWSPRNVEEAVHFVYKMGYRDGLQEGRKRATITPTRKPTSKV